MQIIAGGNLRQYLSSEIHLLQPEAQMPAVLFQWEGASAAASDDCFNPSLPNQNALSEICSNKHKWPFEKLAQICRQMTQKAPQKDFHQEAYAGNALKWEKSGELLAARVKVN